MNKSEIAEIAVRPNYEEILSILKQWLPYYTAEDRDSFIYLAQLSDVERVAGKLERAIAESRGQPCPHLNRVKSTEPDSATLCTDCDTYLPKSELGDGEPSSAPPDRIGEALNKLFDRAEHAGAAQEVSPYNPIERKLLMICPECGSKERDPRRALSTDSKRLYLCANSWHVEEVSPPSPLCKAQRTGVGGNDPIDCDWPFCGCDPKADRVIEAIQESGFEIIRSDAVVLKPRNEAEADWRFPPDGYRKGGAKS